jgi:hypothetical protein
MLFSSDKLPRREKKNLSRTDAKKKRELRNEREEKKKKKKKKKYLLQDQSTNQLFEK